MADNSVVTKAMLNFAQSLGVDTSSFSGQTISDVLNFMAANYTAPEVVPPSGEETTGGSTILPLRMELFTHNHTEGANAVAEQIADIKSALSGDLEDVVLRFSAYRQENEETIEDYNSVLRYSYSYENSALDAGPVNFKVFTGTAMVGATASDIKAEISNIVSDEETRLVAFIYVGPYVYGNVVDEGETVFADVSEMMQGSEDN